MPCPDCAYNAEVAQGANDRAGQLKIDNDRLAAELATASHPLDFDTLTELISHCESGDCASHSEEWRKVKETIVTQAYEGMPPELLLAKAQDLGFIPKRLVIGGTG